MNPIKIGIYSGQRLVCEGLENLFDDNENIAVSFLCHEQSKLNNSVNHSNINVLILDINHQIPVMTRMIDNLNMDFPKVSILILSAVVTEKLLYKTIKAGAKGFLSSESSKNDLWEAIYTLRNGYDYYSKSITHLLLNNYINHIRLHDENEPPGDKSLPDVKPNQDQIDGNSLNDNNLVNKRLSNKQSRDNQLVDKHLTKNPSGNIYLSDKKLIGSQLTDKRLSNIPLSDKQLSPRQQEIVKLWGEGYSNGEIAERLFISIRTVETHKNHIMQKLNLRTNVDLVKFAIRNNLIDL
mgnify:CR=1 FL=1